MLSPTAKKVVLPIALALGANTGVGAVQNKLSDKFIDSIVDLDSSEYLNDARTVALNSLSTQNLPLYKVDNWPNAAFIVNTKTGKKGLLFGKYKGRPMNSREVVAHELGHASNYEDPSANWRIKSSGIRGLFSSTAPFATYLTARLKKLNGKKSLLTAVGVGSLVRGIDKAITLREESEASRKGLDLLKKYNLVNPADRIDIDKAKESLDNAYNTYLFDSLATPAKVGTAAVTAHTLFELAHKAKKLFKKVHK